MKKFITASVATMLSLSLLASCGGTEEQQPVEENQEVQTGDTTGTDSETEEPKETEESVLKVGMVTDSGTIDDKSFNQGTWEGIALYKNLNGNIDTHYLQPQGEDTQDYMNAIHDLVDSGYEMIIAPGFKFEEAMGEAQEIYPDIYFTILDGQPAEIAENTSAIFFAEQESGFYAGIASALSSETGKLAFIGGMEIPAVQKFGWGYVAGVAYANENYGTNATVTDYIYQGTFTDVTAGKTLAAAFYDSGVDTVFSAAGGVGVGVIEEGKTRRSNGENVWVVGVDVDQYVDGMYDNENSVILTSAVKGLSVAAYDSIDSVINGTFQGGEALVFDTTNDGVGLSESQQNLSSEALRAYDDAYEQVKAGAIEVPGSVEELETFLDDHGYTSVVEKY